MAGSRDFAKDKLKEGDLLVRDCCFDQAGKQVQECRPVKGVNSEHSKGPPQRGYQDVFFSDSGGVGTLQIKVIEASDLVEKKKFRKVRGFFGSQSNQDVQAGSIPTCDHVWPFVTLRAGHSTRRSSTSLLSIASNETTCYWEEDFLFESVKASQQVVVTCYIGRTDAEIAGDEKTSPGAVGEVVIPIVRLPEGHPVEQWYQLTPRETNRTCKGAIRLRLLYQIRDDLYSTQIRESSLPDDLPLSPGPSGGMDDAPPNSAMSSTLQTSQALNSTSRRGNLAETVVPAPTPGNLSELAQEELPTGLVDYFTVLGPRINETTGLPTLEEATLLVRYPLEDRPEQPLPQKLEWFCFPSGITLHRGGAPSWQPRLSTFNIKHSGLFFFGVCMEFYRVWTRLSKEMQKSPNNSLAVTLTHGPLDTGSSDGSSKFFGSPINTSLDGYSEFSLGPTNSESAGNDVWAPVCMCLLTRVPVVRQLQYWLVQAYDHVEKLLPGDYDGLLESTSGEALASLFRSHIVQLTQEVPLPVPGALGVRFKMLDREISCRLPGPRVLPPMNYPLSTFMSMFSPRNVIKLVGAALVEARLLLHSREPSILPVVAESITALLYPMHWQAFYLQPVPKDLLAYLDSPFPFILGIHSSLLVDVSKDSLKDVVLVDCDGGTVRMPQRPYQIPSIPDNVAEPVYQRLRALVQPSVDRLDSVDANLGRVSRRESISAAGEHEVRLTFARCLAYLLSGYQDCVFYIDPSMPIFNQSRFMSEYALPEEHAFLTRLFNAQSFQTFLECHSAPYLEFFRAILQSAYEHASRVSSPLTTAGFGPSAPKKSLADFKIIESDDQTDWLGEAADEVVDAPPEIDVKLLLDIPPPPDDPATTPIPAVEGKGRARVFQFSDDDLKQAPSVIFEDEDDNVNSSNADNMNGKVTPRRASVNIPIDSSGSTAVENRPRVAFDEPPPSSPTSSLDESGGNPLSKEVSGTSTASEDGNSPPKRSTLRAMTQSRLALSLITSPTKHERSQSFGDYELDVMMRKKMSPRSARAPPLTPADPKAAVFWRKSRKWTVAEASSMMNVTVRKMAGALGLDFGLQRVMTRAHTIFGFTDTALTSLPSGAGSPQGSEALSGDHARLNRCLMEAFSSERLSPELLSEVESAFQQKDVREKFLTILNQPRSKRQYGNSGPTGQYGVHANGFEALMQLGSAVCNACMAQRDYLTAHTLLQLTGKYYKVLDSVDNSPWASLRAEFQQKEFLSSRLRHHQIFQNIDLWVLVLNSQLKEDDVGGSKGSILKKLPKDLGSTISLTPTGQPTAEGGEREVDLKKMALRVKAVLMEMYGVGMPDQKALAFIGRVGSLYKLDKEQLQTLTPLPQKIWKSSQMEQRQQHPNAAGRRNSITLLAGDAIPEEVEEGTGEPLPPFKQPGSIAGSYTNVMPSLPSRRPNMSSNIFSQFLGETTSHKGPVLCLDVDPGTGLGVSGGADKLILVYGIQQKTRMEAFSGHTGPVTAVKVFADKSDEPVVVSASLDSTVRLWKLSGSSSQSSSVDTGVSSSVSSMSQALARFTMARNVRGVLTGHSKGVLSLDCSPELQLLVTGSMDKLLKLWNVTQGRNLATLVGHQHPVSCVRFIEQAQAYRVLSASHDRTMILWDASKGMCLRVYRGHESWIRCLESCGKDLAVTASNDRTIRVWDLRVHNCVHKLTDHKGSITCLQVLEDATAPLLFSGSTDGTVKVWDIRGGGRCTASLEGHSEAVTCLELQASEGQQKVVSAGEDRRLIEYDIRSGTILQSRMAHKDGISCMRVCESHTIITGSWDSSVRLWNSTRPPR